MIATHGPEVADAPSIDGKPQLMIPRGRLQQSAKRVTISVFEASKIHLPELTALKLHALSILRKIISEFWVPRLRLMPCRDLCFVAGLES